MTIKGINCNACTKPMPERLTKPMQVVHSPVRLTNGNVHRYSTKAFSTGSEFKPVMVPNHDLGGNALEPREELTQVITPEDFDLCPRCQLALLEKAVAEIKEHLKNEERDKPDA